MTEQEKQDDAQDAGAEEAPEEAPEEAKEANQPSAARERRPARAERGPAPAQPQVAVVPQTPRSQPLVSRRGILRLGFWSSLGAILAGTAAAGVNSVWPRSVTGFGGTVSVGNVSQFPPGSKTQVGSGRFWLVNLTQEQGGPGLLALWWKCPHLGCTVPWKPGFVWPEPTTGAPKQGWFRCPCHGSTYTDAGIRVFGPAPRSMDTMHLTIDGGRISVDTGDVTPGAPDNADRVVRA